MDIINYQSRTAYADESGSSYNPGADSWIHGAQQETEHQGINHDLNQINLKQKNKTVINNGRVINRKMINLSSLLQKQYYSYAVNNDMAICRNASVGVAQDNYINSICTAKPPSSIEAEECSVSINSSCTALKPPSLIETEECFVSTNPSTNYSSTVLTSSVTSSVDNQPSSLLQDSTNSSSCSSSQNSVNYSVSASLINSANQKPAQNGFYDRQACALKSPDYVANRDMISARRSLQINQGSSRPSIDQYSTEGEAQICNSGENEDVAEESDTLIEFIPDRHVIKTSTLTEAEYNLENQYPGARKLQSSYRSDGRIDVRTTAAAAGTGVAGFGVHRNDSKTKNATSTYKLPNNNFLHSGRKLQSDTNHNNMAPLNYSINYSSADQYNYRRPVPSKWDDAERWLQISKPEVTESATATAAAAATRRTFCRNKSTTDRSCHGGDSAFSGRTDRSQGPLSTAASSGNFNTQSTSDLGCRRRSCTKPQLPDVHILHRDCTTAKEMETDQISDKIDVVCQQDDVVRAAAIKLSELVTGSPIASSSNIYWNRGFNGNEVNMQSKASCTSQFSPAQAFPATVNMIDAGTEVERDYGNHNITIDNDINLERDSREHQLTESSSCCSSPAAEPADAAPAEEASPPRHNTPARRSSNDGSVSVLALESCHLEKLNLATWLKQDNSCDAAAARDAGPRHVEFGPDSRGVSVVRHVDSLAKLLEYNSKDEKQQSRFNIAEARAAAWEEVEKAKHTAKFKREEAKIEAWESLQRAEADAELRKLEAKLEKLRFEGRERILGKLSTAQRRAQEMRAAAEAHKAEQIARVSQRAAHLRRNSQIPGHLIHVCFTKKPSTSFLT